FFGSRVDPAPDRLRHPLIAWVLVSVVVLATLFLLIVPDIVDVARAWGDVLWADRILSFFAANAIWAPAGVAGGMAVLALWARVNRVRLVIVILLSLLRA